MKYYSLNKQSPVVDFKEATIRGQAPDKGLYFPERIPIVDRAIVEQIENIADEEIAFRIILPYVGETIPEAELYRIVQETINFPIPLVSVTPDIYSLELFHGPTLAFKDVGARFMSRCLGYFTKNRKGRIIVLVATSGDTGGAVASGFYEVEGIDVVILYPEGGVSAVQEKQLTTLGKNIHALEVAGNFDDCQQLVKQAFADVELNKSVFLTSANSINVARWLPQQFYYFFAWKQWANKGDLPVISVPSGNLGNICAGMLAWRSGLPVQHFIAACNANDAVAEFLRHDFYQPKTAVRTISNAMDVGDPSNFIRVLELFTKEPAGLKEILSGYSIPDAATSSVISEVYKNAGYLLDPHGAVAYLSLQNYLEKYPGKKGIFLETAHPVKFREVIEQVIPNPVFLIDDYDMSKEKKSKKIKGDYSELKAILEQL